MNSNHKITAIDPIKEAEFVSVWDGGFAVSTSCKVKLFPNYLFAFEFSVESAVGMVVLDELYITIYGEMFPLFDAETDDGYWYKG